MTICESGLHASRKAWDALQYAPGPYVTLCEVRGIVTEEGDKLVCHERRPLWGYDATNVLRLFARRCALDVIHLWDAPDVVKRYLETGDESLRAAARGAAWDAARDAARDDAIRKYERWIDEMLRTGRDVPRAVPKRTPATRKRRAA